MTNHNNCSDCASQATVAKNTNSPSIFNDVLGPVMRGPSSSHCAASVRIGRMARDLMGNEIEHILIEFHPQGSLATTHESQGSDMGLFAGFLGWEATDERMIHAASALRAAGIQVEIQIVDFPASHPNTYKITLQNSNESHTIIALSTGGGIVEIVSIDGIRLTLCGDYFETLVFTTQTGAVEQSLQESEIYEAIVKHPGVVQIKSQKPLGSALLAKLESQFSPAAVKQINPVLPVLSRINLRVPFITCAEVLEFNRHKSMDLSKLALEYEAARGNISTTAVLDMIHPIAQVMRAAIEKGIAGTQFDDRILGPQSGKFQDKMWRGGLIDAGALNRIVLYNTAIMEAKSGMEPIVAAPTAGSCGAMPAAVFAVADTMDASEEQIAMALLAAGLIGVFIAAHATFAAEVGGCQAECGAASGMAAAALVTLAAGTLHQSLAAASMAIQNSLGMICDPVANRVEVPCLGKNTIAASNALACANMALADFDPVIPLDEVIETMDRVGKMLPAGLCCTATAGLSVTPTSLRIEKKLRQKMR